MNWFSKKLEFDLKGTAITASDILDVELKDYESVGTNKYRFKINFV